jgi:hypothetical protein
LRSLCRGARPNQSCKIAPRSKPSGRRGRRNSSRSKEWANETARRTTCSRVDHRCRLQAPTASSLSGRRGAVGSDVLTQAETTQTAPGASRMPSVRDYREQAELCLELARHVSDRSDRHAADPLGVAAARHFATPHSPDQTRFPEGADTSISRQAKAVATAYNIRAARADAPRLILPHHRRATGGRRNEPTGHCSEDEPT